MPDNKTSSLTEQERIEIAKLFEEFAASNWDNENNEKEIADQECASEPQEKEKINKKSILIIISTLLAFLLIASLILYFLFDPQTTQKHTTLSAGSHLVAAITSNGTVLSPSSASSLGGYVLTTQTTDVSGWSDIVSISVGTRHTLGLKSDGTVVCTTFITPDKVLPDFLKTDPNKGQLEITAWENIIAVAAGYSHSVGLRKDGTVVAIGDNSCGQCDVNDWKDIVQIAAGEKHTVGLKKDGTVVSTKVPASQGDDGQCNTETWTNIVCISAGPLTTIGVRNDGTVVAAGANALGQCNVATWTDIISVAAGCYHTVGLRKNGTVVSTEIIQSPTSSYTVDYNQDNVSTWHNIVEVAVTNQQTFGLKQDGTVVYVGLNTAEMSETKHWKDIRLP